MLKTDIQLIKEIKKNRTDESYLQLKERYEKVFYRLCAYYTNTKLHVSYEELCEGIDFVLWKSIKSYKLNKKTKFSTWFAYETRFYCLKILRKKHPVLIMENKDLEKIIDKSGYNHDTSEKNDGINYIFNILNQIEDKRIHEIYKLRYCSSKTLKSFASIGKKLKLSTTQIINLHERGRKLLKRKIDFEKEKV